MSHGAPQLLAKHDSRCIYEGVSELIRIWVVEWVKQIAFLMKVKNEGEKAGLKLNIQKTKIMAPDPISSWQIDAETVEQWQTLFSWAPKSLWLVTAAMTLKDTCSLEGKLWQT